MFRRSAFPALLLGASTLASSPLSAAGPPGVATSPDATVEALRGEDFREEFLRDFANAASKFVALARAMPAGAYDWRPGEGVASVAEVFAHIARYNYWYPETSLDTRPPAGIDTGSMERTLPPGGKDEVVAELERSMAHVRAYVEGMSAADLEAETRLYGRTVAQRAVLLQLLTHMHEHLGQSIAYARMNDVVPPWSM